MMRERGLTRHPTLVVKSLLLSADAPKQGADSDRKGALSMMLSKCQIVSGEIDITLCNDGLSKVTKVQTMEIIVAVNN